MDQDLIKQLNEMVKRDRGTIPPTFECRVCERRYHARSEVMMHAWYHFYASVWWTV